MGFKKLIYDKSIQYDVKQIYSQFINNEEYRLYITLSNYIPETNRIRVSNVHDANHSKRVLFLVLMLSMLSNLNKTEKSILAYAAAYHDIGRKNDLKDDTHGYRSFKQLSEKKEFKVLINSELTTEEVNILEFIIKNHCIEDKIAYRHLEHYPIANKELAIKLFKYLKDADNLDRIRIGDLDASYLRIDISKRLVEFAKWLYNNKEIY